MLNLVPLTDDQQQRLSALRAVRDALLVGEVEVWDAIRCAHWVWSGHEMEISELHEVSASKTWIDEALWDAKHH